MSLHTSMSQIKKASLKTRFENFLLRGFEQWIFHPVHCPLQISYLFMQHRIPVIRHVSGNHFIFQRDSAPAHRTRDTIELLRHTTPDFIAPDMATELTRPQSGGLYHLTCHSATCVWDQSSRHHWAVTVSTACVARLGAVVDWWRSWPMANALAFVPVADILNMLCDYQFVFSVSDVVYVSHHAWCNRQHSNGTL